MGADEELLAVTVATAREQSETRLAELETERRSNQRELQRLHAKIQKLLLDQPEKGETKPLVAGQLTNLPKTGPIISNGKKSGGRDCFLKECQVKLLVKSM